MPSFTRRYVQLVTRHLGRPPRPSDGTPPSILAAAEHRLSVKPPTALRDYYRLAGKVRKINRDHNLLYPPSKLRIAEAHLWFLEENQAVVHWGIPLAPLRKRNPPQDPFVYQRVNAEPFPWHSEEKRLSTFLIQLFDWQAGFIPDPST